MDKIELTPQELTKIVGQAVYSEVNLEVNRALQPIRQLMMHQVFVMTAMVTALVVVAFVTGDDRTLGPAFVIAMTIAGSLPWVWLKARPREIEVRAQWVPLDKGEEGVAIAKRDSDGDE